MIVNIPRRPINELIARYHYEPTAKDIFVEGTLDQTLIKRFLHQSRIYGIGIIPIRLIDVPDRLLLSHEVGSDKGRLTALARYLEAELGFEAAPVRCVVDRDYDSILCPLDRPLSGLVLKTDLSSIEMYFFDAVLLDRALSYLSGAHTVDPMLLLETIGDTLAVVSSIFAASQTLDLNCSRIEVSRCSTYNQATGLRFDSAEYLARYFNKGAAMDRRCDVEEEMVRISDGAPDDIRTWVRGRDFLPLLSFALRNHQGIKSQDCQVSILEEYFKLSIGVDYLQRFPLFKALIGWCANA